jgi:hypothetical protein
MKHPFTLEPYKGTGTRYVCPQCGQKQMFVRYIDAATGAHLAPHVGRCNREVACGYHYKPKQYFAENPNLEILNSKGVNPKSEYLHPKKKKPQSPITNSQLPFSTVQETMCCYGDNHFVRFLNTRYPQAVVDAVVQRYCIGTHHYWDGGTVFWQIDAQGVVRTGKVMLYNPATGKRFRQPHSHIHWMHSIVGGNDYRLKQCLFGEHLLPGNTLPIAIAESEKTAILGSIHMPQYLWLAAGSLSNLTTEKCKHIGNRPITLFPDAGAIARWSAIAATLPNCTVDTSIEQLMDGCNGCDMADYWLAA